MLLVASQCLFRIPILTQSCIVQAKRLREAQRAGVSLVDARTGFGTRATQTRIPTGTTSAATLDDYDMKSMPYVRRLNM